MPTSKQNRCKRIIQTLLALFFIVNVNAQAESLLPEFDFATGLPSNSVRCIKLDKSRRLWVGTDNGLSIINSKEAAHKRIVDAMNQKSIWSLAFVDSLVILGTRYNGLFIFNHYTGNLLKAYPTSTINQIRKIKIIDNQQVFILTNEDVFIWEKHLLHKLQMKYEHTQNKEFILELFQWNNKIWGVTNWGRQMVMDNKNRFLESQLIEKQYSGCYFSSLKKDSILYLGGYGNKNTISVIRKNKPIQSIDMPSIFSNTFVIFDMAYYKGKYVLAVGDTRTNETGAICILDSNFSAIEVKVTDYVLCLEIDSVTNTLYYGTLNKGVYMQRGLASSQMFNKQIGSSITANGKYIFSYNSTSFKRIDATSTGKPFKKDNIVGGITSFSIEGDTIVTVTKKNVNVYTANDLMLIRAFKYENATGNVLYSGRVNNTVFTFENYGNAHRYNLVKPYEKPNDYTIFLPHPLKVGNSFFCLNKEKGFVIIGENWAYPLKCLDSSIAFINDFTVVGDKLYTLSNQELKTYLISSSNQLILKATQSIINQVDGFVPKWILSNNGSLYLLNEKAVVKVNPVTLTPTHYYYLGNYNQIAKPIITGDSLLVVSNSYVTKFPFNNFENEIQQVGNVDWGISIPEAVNENLGFQVIINSPDNLLLNHSLKQLEVWQDGKLVRTLYTVTEQFLFNEGLKYGDYEFKIFIGNNIKTKKVSITLPLNRNPYFFGAILFFILVVAAILFKTMLDKRKTKKQLLKNRLEILKQNLNPHFVYNSMNLISSLILEGKNDEAVQVVADFSNLQRSYLETNNKLSISLKEELDFLGQYLSLQQKRFQHDNQFTYTINIDKQVDINEIKVPPLILQPIAENAIKYGIVGSDVTNKKITINIKGNNPTIINIEDNGSYSGQDGGIGIGQKLVKERLEIFAKTNHKKIAVAFGEPTIYSNKGYRVNICVY